MHQILNTKYYISNIMHQILNIKLGSLKNALNTLFFKKILKILNIMY